MAELKVSHARAAPAGADLAVRLATVEDVRAAKDDALKLAAFEGKPGQVSLQPGAVWAGLGPAAAVDGAAVRRAAATAARAASRASHVWLDVAPEHVQPAVEGVLLGAYAFSTYRSEPPPSRLRRLAVVSDGARGAVRAGIDRAVAIAGAQNLVRDLVNEPGGTLTPTVLADRVVEAAAAAGVDAVVHDADAIAELGFGGLLAVARGSAQPPRFVELTYTPAGADDGTPTVALIGKGVTFDSGGLSIKPAEGMASMKSDMAGAATVAGALTACGAAGVGVRVRGLLPLTDNMLGADATRVGDIIRHYGGSTTEVLNTDAEGRLLLADALAFACDGAAGRPLPDAMVDLATLTGAIRIALGMKVAGLFGRGDGWLGQVEAAAARAGERLWRMPMLGDERRQLDSKVADRKNVGGRFASSIVAALFLADFVPARMPWAHIDMAGPAFNESGDDGEAPAGGTGYGVRTLLELLGGYEEPDPRP